MSHRLSRRECRGETCPRERKNPREEGKNKEISPFLRPREERKRLYSFSIALRASAEGAIGSFPADVRPKGTPSRRKVQKNLKNFKNFFDSGVYFGKRVVYYQYRRISVPRQETAGRAPGLGHRPRPRRRATVPRPLRREALARES